MHTVVCMHLHILLYTKGPSFPLQDQTKVALIALLTQALHSVGLSFQILGSGLNLYVLLVSSFKNLMLDLGMKCELDSALKSSPSSFSLSLLDKAKHSNALFMHQKAQKLATKSFVESGLHKTFLYS